MLLVTIKYVSYILDYFIFFKEKKDHFNIYLHSVSLLVIIYQDPKTITPNGGSLVLLLSCAKFISVKGDFSD